MQPLRLGLRLGLGLGLACAPVVSAAIHRIDNGILAVSYDDAAGTFSVAENPSGAVFLKDGHFDGTASKASSEAANDPTFGPGKRIMVARTDGNSNSLEVYRNLPFVLVRSRLHNKSQETIDISKVVPATFTLDLGKPPTELRTMGTAGLTNPDAHPGSYLFLTLADPATRRGVVAGWLTQDRGSGVLFSAINEGKVGFRAQLDHGHLLIPAGQSARLETLAIGLFDDARFGQEQYADAIAKHYKIRLHPQTAGYCNWYNYFKMDGLWTGTATEQIYVNAGYRDDQIGNNAPYHDPSKTNIEAFRDGLKLLREAAGPDVFFSGCNVSQNMRSFGGSLGLVDSMRIGPDNGTDWSAASQELSATSQIVGGDPCELRIAGLQDGPWKLASAVISQADQTAGVTFSAKPPVPGETGWLRVLIASPVSRTVQWKLKFETARE
jgi:hypothetical protein